MAGAEADVVPETDVAAGAEPHVMARAEAAVVTEADVDVATGAEADIVAGAEANVVAEVRAWHKAVVQDELGLGLVLRDGLWGGYRVWV